MMRGLSPWPWSVLTCVCLALMSAAVAIHPIGDRASPAGSMPASAGGVILPDDVSPDDFRPLPPNVRIQRHVAGGTPRDGGTGRAAPEDDILVYSNTHGLGVYRFGMAWVHLADDLVPVAVEGCELSKLLIRVTGAVYNGSGEFEATVALFDVCPGTLPYYAPALPGTELTFRGLSDDAQTVHELVVDYSSGNIGICDDLRACRVDEQDCIDGSPCLASPPPAVPSEVYVRVMFNIEHAGWVGGSNPELGYSSDQYYHLFIGCPGHWWGECLYGPCPPGSFYVQIYARPKCAKQFFGYRASVPWASPYAWGSETENHRLADDLTLLINDCELSSYEVGVIGEAGPYEMEIDLREHPALLAIPGTSRTLSGVGNGNVETARFTFGEGINLPQSLWITWRANKPDTAVALTRVAQIGSSTEYYGYEGQPFAPPGEWRTDITLYGGGPAIFNASIFCRGDAPTGACCRNENFYQSVGCFDDTWEFGCWEGRWVESVACDDDSFVPPCGTHACCLPDDSCGNLTETVCTDAGGVWEPGDFCGENQQDCGWFVCRDAGGDCHFPYPSPGCYVPYCCNRVCGVDPTCCADEWDETCVELAQERCPFRPGNDDCWNEDPERGAYIVDANSTTVFGTGVARVEYDQGFCCSKRSPGWGGFASAWFKFEATHTSTRVSTCQTSDVNARDSLIQVFSVGDPSTPQTACETLTTMACNDDSAGCGSGLLSDICVTELVPGEIYYIELGSSTPDDVGVYQLDIESPCPADPQPACPDGDVEWVDPPYAVIDARQPRASDDLEVLQGIDTIEVTAPDGADLSDGACWSLCETAAEGAQNGIAHVTDNNNGSYAIELDRPITPGALTTITYTSGSGCTVATGYLYAQPGDVNADGARDTSDIVTLVNCCLDDTCEPAFSNRSCDIDHSDNVNAADLIRLIDLANCAEPFRPGGWCEATSLPYACGSVCGGEGDIPCEQREFCKLPLGVCTSAGHEGVCIPIPTVCPSEGEPVCGCYYGVTYANECHADMARRRIDHVGPCEP